MRVPVKGSSSSCLLLLRQSRRNQAASVIRATARIAPTTAPTIVPVFGAAVGAVVGAVEAMDAEEDVVCGEEAPTLSTIVTLVPGATGAVGDEEDGITEILELGGPCEELVVDLREEVIVDVAASTFSLSKTTERKRIKYHLCLLR